MNPGGVGSIPTRATITDLIMTGTELAIKLGYTISKDGIVSRDNQIYKLTRHTSSRAMLFTFRHDGRKYIAYAGKLQAYTKFGDIALNDTTYYLDGNYENVSYDNVSLLSIEQQKARNASTKICAKCGRELPITDFVFKDKKNNRRAPRCKECDREDKRKSYSRHYSENKEKFIERRKTFERSNKDAVINRKKCGCLICGEKDVACLDFHHLGNKEFTIANETRNKSKEELMREIDKCVVLCANCHRKLHYYNLSLEELKQHVSVPSAA